MLSRMLLLATTAAAAPALAVGAPGAMTCRTVAADPQRTWRFVPVGARWQVTHWTGAQERDAVSLALPASTEVRLSPQAVSVAARTSNGGIALALSGTPEQATLDVYVSYELEVNVDTSLTPRIDELNTEGPTGVRCEVRAAP